MAHPDKTHHNDKAIYDLATRHMGGDDAKPPKKVKEIRTRKGKTGGYIHEHHHEHPEHHSMEEHTSPDQAAMLAHMTEHMGGPDASGADANAGEGGVPAQQAATPPAPSGAPVA